jgi:hypothetical protein
VDLSSLLYDHRLVDAYQNSSEILQSTIFTQQYVFMENIYCPYFLFSNLTYWYSLFKKKTPVWFTHYFWPMYVLYHFSSEQVCRTCFICREREDEVL